MPFKSEAQRDKFRQWLKEGKISKADFAKWEEGTPDRLPKRLADISMDKKRRHK